MSLTSANAVISLSQTTLFPTPVILSNFAADFITDIESVRILEHQMGVDGVLSFGFVFAERIQEIALKGDSLSNQFFDIVNQQQEAAQDAYPLNGTILLPSAGVMLNMSNGGLENYKQIPAVLRTLQTRRYRIVWGRIQTIPTR